MTTANNASRSATTRGTLWSDTEIKVLIKIWGEENIQDELDGAVRNRSVFNNISKQMNEQGYSRDWEQCKTKIKNLKKKYRDVKDHNGETGRGRKTCKFFDELDEILGHRPASVPTTLLDTGTSNPVESEEENLTDSKE